MWNMSDNMYSEKVMDHFRNPRNMGKLENPDAVGKVGNLACGDVMWIYIKVKENTINEIGWETMGCAAAISTTSMISELAKGKTLEEAMQIERKEVIEALGGLPGVKIHCSALAADALHEAIYDYLARNNMPVPKALDENHKRLQGQLKQIEERYQE
jgi:nitrogen fixation NifU-like protein